MRAVWSFWSKPFQRSMGRTWRGPLHHCLAWGLSLRLARRYYRETVLVTDKAGAAFLVDQLGLPFTHVSTDLEQIRKADAGWWALGKLLAYSLQDEPFVHLDTDVFLWKPLPPRVAEAAVFGQCPENYHSIDQWCGPRTIEDVFARHGLKLPEEWHWSRARWGDRFCEANCGIAGGTRVDFLRYYARLALDIILKPEHAPAWAELPGKDGFNQIMEQFLLAACVEYHQLHPDSRHRGIHIRYLFPTIDQAFDPAQSARVGFTHLCGDLKANAFVADRLEQRVKREDPKFYRHCVWLNQNRELFAMAGG
jgi:hypothetical protein